MGKAHQNEKKTAQPKCETNAPATRKINTINRKQTPPIQSSTQNHMDLWNSAMGDSGCNTIHSQGIVTREENYITRTTNTLEEYDAQKKKKHENILQKGRVENT
jgi:hypothetical protein